MGDGVKFCRSISWHFSLSALVQLAIKNDSSECRHWAEDESGSETGKFEKSFINVFRGHLQNNFTNAHIKRFLHANKQSLHAKMRCINKQLIQRSEWWNCTRKQATCSREWEWVGRITGIECITVSFSC